MNKPEIEQFYPKTNQHLRTWLQKNHLTKDAVWIIFYKKNAGKPTVTWSDAVDEALCFGWIDSRAETIDDNTFRQYFCKRKHNSTWSKINKQKLEKLMSKGLMAPAGLEVIEIAKQNGSWTILDEVEELMIPSDLEEAFTKFDKSKDIFLTLSKSKKKYLLQWIALAKTEVTRQKRILEIAESAFDKQLSKLFTPKKKSNS
ncbi:hypothetical protein DBR39_10380 [Chryseobacterium sp. KBW03]|uniref:YdeI/OmpD-associated family protein n=1 Tax=Chryseobacterium sp. KBW03 TaxID=2153362 RepID=UPI000F595D5D|nr:YdeI/OmpD-associated family protein [Chryseobacterium sp. KBW03]RQO39377.1 hypothetical protein DBR39_10380 [Chryseobacterium sp. KBW03]